MDTSNPGITPEPSARRIEGIVNVPDPEECRRAAREDRDYWNDHDDHADE